MKVYILIRELKEDYDSSPEIIGVYQYRRDAVELIGRYQEFHEKYLEEINVFNRTLSKHKKVLEELYESKKPNAARRRAIEKGMDAYKKLYEPGCTEGAYEEYDYKIREEEVVIL